MHQTIGFGRTPAEALAEVRNTAPPFRTARCVTLLDPPPALALLDRAVYATLRWAQRYVRALPPGPVYALPLSHDRWFLIRRRPK